jgi:hypothetical protein
MNFFAHNNNNNDRPRVLHDIQVYGRIRVPRRLLEQCVPPREGPGYEAKGVY